MSKNARLINAQNLEDVSEKSSQEEKSTPVLSQVLRQSRSLNSGGSNPVLSHQVSFLQDSMQFNRRSKSD